MPSLRSRPFSDAARPLWLDGCEGKKNGRISIVLVQKLSIRWGSNLDEFVLFYSTILCMRDVTPSKHETLNRCSKHQTNKKVILIIIGPKFAKYFKQLQMRPMYFNLIYYFLILSILKYIQRVLHPNKFRKQLMVN